MSNMTNYLEAIKYLKTSPMFNLSLASKELFHSNFLQFISLLDKTTFKEIIKDLGGEVKNWGNDEEWEVVREYKNLDLCVKRCDKDYELIHQCKNRQENEVKHIEGEILFVLENKFKSIPYKSQLIEYDRKILEHNTNYWKENFKILNEVKRWSKKFGKKEYYQPSKILLTLVCDFPEENDIQTWNIVTYAKLCEVLTKYKEELIINYKNKCNDNVSEIKSDYINGILNDYIIFLECLVFLFANHWKEYRTPNSHIISNNEEYLERKNLRIHDLFDKQRYAALCGNLIQQFNHKSINVEFVTPNDDDMLTIGTSKDKKKKYDKRETYFEDKKIFIGVGFGYAHSIPLLEIKVIHKNDKKNIIYHIQAQGDRYMHGIIVAKKNIKGLSAMQNKNESLENLVQKEIISDIIPGWMSTNGNDISGEIFVNCKDNGKYSKYNGATANNIVIYKHKQIISTTPFQALFDQMLKDTKYIISELENKFSV